MTKPFNQTAEQTRQRELVEDTVLAVADACDKWESQGRIGPEVNPIGAVREGDHILVYLNNGSIGLVYIDEPERNLLDGK